MIAATNPMKTMRKTARLNVQFAVAAHPLVSAKPAHVPSLSRFDRALSTR
jgi:hypothetical protein